MADILILVLIGAMMVLGYRGGLIVSSVVIFAMAAGAGTGALLLSLVSRSAGATAAIIGAVMVGIFVTMHLEPVHEFVEERVSEAWRQIDRAAGAVATGVVACVIIWAIAAVMTIAPSGTGAAEALRVSRTSQVLLQIVSPTGGAGTLLIRSGLVPDLDGPIIIADPPDERVLEQAGVKGAGRGVVHVEGIACERIVYGSGWVAARELVVTNAHVVAGQKEPFVRIDGEVDRYRAQVLVFDAHNDLAVLRVPQLPLAPLARRDTALRHGEDAAVVGFPRRYVLTLYPARFDRIVGYDATDIYQKQRGPTRLLAFRGEIHEGNSGSPIIDAQGRVAGTVTAKAEAQRVDGGYAVPDSVLSTALARLGAPVQPGPCLFDEGPKEL